MHRGEKKIAIVVEEGVELLQRYLPKRATPSEVEPVEALYLLYTEAARLYDEQGRMLNFEQLMRMLTILNPYAWVEFEVYLDLRRRGRIPVPGPRSHTFLLRRSKRDTKYTHYILVLEENRPVSLSLINSFVEEALKNNWEPILAIVDRYGDITYYSVTLFHPQPARTMQHAGENTSRTTQGI
ncbi:hypothetical protein [Hyperthermus butylicus]|uniref:tRNA intron endonuclease catalytic domain-containing protein n=1 Tax=Hyperthermus butylicus (strain DSM 5456 / JCM 9403 / PLM1-5) TaxID=415426 RepID=A2BLE2_HYPBU|nr:hypothetical protein [Hyperthermus butylicus]ABM80803.1 hypothetical protein Hbut_0955 [Hyperthermus butylicus DSM 5456]